MNLKGRVILLGVTGSIAAYKAAELASQLIQGGAEVYVILTKNAKKFISEATFRSLVGKEVITDSSKDGNIHVNLAEVGEVFLIVPATANTLAKITYGIADNLLTTVALNFNPSLLIVAPAMNEKMYLASITQKNLAILKERGVNIIPPEKGFLACGHRGIGRLANIDSILERTKEILENKERMKGKVVLITAGAIQEPIDPIRCITNRASGKLGYALAEAATTLGAQVILIATTGVNLPTPSRLAEFYRVTTTKELEELSKKLYNKADIILFTAAVADYKLRRTPYKAKLKSAAINLKLVKTRDIIKDLGKAKRNNQLLVGFSVDTEDPIKEGEKKLKEKNLDFIVVCSPESMGAEEAKVTILSKAKERVDLPLLNKSALAFTLLERLCK
jgi:phosphopantothenoylcysteine decarboxylase/phosphopantothenate--cysteine ligase